MSSVVMLGATASLGTHVTPQAIPARHRVMAVALAPSRLAADVRDKVRVGQCDLGAVSPGALSDLLGGRDAVINSAGRRGVDLPRWLLLPVFGCLIPEMIVQFANAASLMLANLDRDYAMSRHRLGLAPPVGMRGRMCHGVARLAHAV